MDARLSCCDDAGEDQVSLYWCDWLRRQECSMGARTSLNTAFSKPVKHYLPARPSKFLFPFDFEKTCIMRERGLCHGLKLTTFALRFQILGNLPVALERTSCLFSPVQLYIFGDRRQAGVWGLSVLGINQCHG